MVHENECETEHYFETAVRAGVFVKPSTTTMYWWDVAVGIVPEKEQKRAKALWTA